MRCILMLTAVIIVTTGCSEANEALKFGCNAARVAQEIANGEENQPLTEATTAACERTAHCNERAAENEELSDEEKRRRQEALQQMRTMCRAIGPMVQMARVQGRDCEDALQALFECVAEADCADFGEENEQGVCHQHEESVQEACGSSFE